MGSILAATAMSAFALGSGATSTPAEAALPPQDIVSDTIATYAIPAGSMAGALTAFAEKNHLHLLYDARTTRHLRSPGLVGSHSLREGLDRLLSGTGYTYRFADVDGGISIVLAQADNGVRSDAGAEALPTIEIGAESGARNTQGRPGGGQRGAPQDREAYKVWNATSATKTDTPIMNTPVSIQAVPRQVISDQQAVVIDEAVRNVSNVYTVPYVGLQGGWNIRGFLDYAYYQDGVRVNPFMALPPRDTVDVQQIEVVKGPASILYGRIQPGGLVEVTTKRPEAEPHYEVQQLFGSYGQYRTLLSATGPVTPDKSLLYRLDVAYQNENSFRDGLHDYHIYVAPKIFWQPTEDTSGTFYLQFYNGRDAIDTGIPALYDPSVPKSWNVVAAVPRSRNYGSVDSAMRSKSDFRVGYNFTHAFDKDWKITQRLDISLRDIPESWIDVYPPTAAGCAPGACPVFRDAALLTGREQSYFGSLELTGHFDTYGLAHTLLTGVDGYRTNDDYAYPSNSGLVPATDLFSSAYPSSLMQFTTYPDSKGHDTYKESWYGVYLQDQIELPYNFHLLAGFRYDSARNNQNFTTLFPDPSASSKTFAADAVKPRVALLWRPIPELSLYGNYVEGFGIGNGAGVDGNPLPPEEARQWEAGAKIELLDGRLTATAAWFDIVKTNVRSPVGGIGGAIGIARTTGAVENKGVEFDVQGQLLPELKIIGSYANVDSRIISDTRDGRVGNHWWGVPRNAGSLWAVYEPQFEPVRGFAFGAGFVTRGPVEIDEANSFTLPGYTVVDLMSRYSFDYDKKKITFQLNVGNLLDQTYYISSGWTGNFIPGSPRHFRGSVKVEF
ncbi:TonB-dependent siderophore receptor [Methylosinus sporium]|uniref:TonB-dependent siderophore receptor n=1 Tax=Methylosinus sporium TaxID=428 RepID=UPI00383AC9EA